jgi:hypothetical protein
MGGGEDCESASRKRSQKNRFDKGETERFEFQGVIKNRYEQWITKIQSHRVSWSTKSERWSSVRVGYRTYAQKQLVPGKQIGQFRSRRINHFRPG